MVGAARSGLAFSVLLRPRVPVPLLGWASLLTGVAVATAVRRMTAWSQTGEGSSATAATWRWTRG